MPPDLQDKWARYYKEAQGDSGLYAKRFCELYERTMLCQHKRPAPDGGGQCDDKCFHAFT